MPSVRRRLSGKAP
ncbi:hypothetical protein FUT87_21825, partial [Mitsuaria sp. TWR114]